MSNGHSVPCNLLTELMKEVQKMNLEYVKNIIEIQMSIEQIELMHNNHWNEIKETLIELKGTVKLVNGHDTILKNMKEEKLNTQKNAQWRVGLIVGIVMAIVSILGNIFVKVVLK